MPKMDVEDDILDIVPMVTLLKEARDCLNEMRERRYCVKPQYRDRDTNGFFALHFDRIYNRNTEQFRKLIGMGQDAFDLLFGLLKDVLTKNSNKPAISPKCRLFLTLHYLCQGGTKKLLCEKFKMGNTTVKKIISETCFIIWEELNKRYICPPKGEEWLCIAKKFRDELELSNCVGAVDTKRINLTNSSNLQPLKINKNSKPSIALLAVCDVEHIFTNIDVGLYNSETNNTTWNLTFYNQLIKGNLNLPANDFLPNSDIKFPYYMIGNSSFPLKTYLMRPYPENQVTADRLILNKYLTKTHSAIENAFGILTARWKILRSPMQMNPNSAVGVIKATILLHNFLKMHDDCYCPPGSFDVYESKNLIEEVWQPVIDPLQNHGSTANKNATQLAFDSRDYLMYYINSIKTS